MSFVHRRSLEDLPWREPGTAHSTVTPKLSLKGGDGGQMTGRIYRTYRQSGRCAFAYVRSENSLLVDVEGRVRSLRLCEHALVGKFNPPSAYALIFRAFQGQVQATSNGWAERRHFDAGGMYGTYFPVSVGVNSIANTTQVFHDLRRPAALIRVIAVKHM